MSYLSRAIQELEDLSLRVERLEVFLESDDFDKLGDADQVDLSYQYGRMLAYGTVLSRRIARFCGNDV